MYRLLICKEFSFRILRHLILFLSMVILFTWINVSRFDEPDGFLQNFQVVSLNALIFFGYAYLTAYLLIPVFLIRRKFVVFAILFIAIGFGLSMLKFAVSDFLFYSSIAPENPNSIAGMSVSGILVNTKDMTFIVAVFAIAKYAKDHYVLKSNIQELEEKQLQAEIKLLDYHLDPHVIFNNLNSLYSISIYQRDILQSTLGKFRSILHYLFDESRKEKVLLSKEIDMIDNYIGLEKLRYGDRLEVTFEKEGDFQNHRIAPLILYSFVENCFVHGAGNDPMNSWIKIRLSVKCERLLFTAANSVSRFSPGAEKTGVRNPNELNIRRLELYYPNDHQLKIRDKQEEYVVELNMNL
ncbi:MAG: histidine kinase [Bacteroidales bacterium]